MKLSVVIVTYNVRYYLEQCLKSLYRALEDISAEVFVIDNASTDASECYIKERFPSVSYIYNKVNLGFSRANNMALQEAKGEYVLLLNPDTVLAEDTIVNVLAYMEEHPDCGAAGTKMLASDGTFLPESKRGYPTLTATFGKLSGLGKLFPSMGKYYCSTMSEDEIHMVDVLTGAFLMIRHSALDCCGLLDERFFMYGEDVDFSCRLRTAGYLNCYLPYSIIHYKGKSTEVTSTSYVRHFYGAMKLFYRKHHTSKKYIEHFFVNMGIKTLMYYKYIHAFLHRKIMSKKSDENAYSFLVYANEETIHSLRRLFRRNSLGENHHFVVANELSTPNGHGGEFLTSKYTHVLYDSQAYSYKKIIELLEINRVTKLKIALYDTKSRILVTPERCFC